MSGNTKDTPFFAPRNSAVSWTVMTFKKKTVAKDNYKLFEKLELHSALTPFFCSFQLIEALKCDFQFDGTIVMNTTMKAYGWLKLYVQP